MAADVGYLMRVMNGGDSTDSGKSKAPITRDLLGGCCTVDSKELDLDLQVPRGWEKRLDLQSGKVYLRRREASDATAARASLFAGFKDLSFPQSSAVKPPTLNLFSDPTSDTRILPSSVSSSDVYASSSSSVCTLDKVRSALERAEMQTGGARKRSVSKSSSTSSSSVKDGGDMDQEERSTAASFAAGCPGCLLYVLVSRSNPRCPRCNCNIPVPDAMKKPRIDLNMYI